MDVQGTRYHLLNGAADWAECQDVALGVRLGDVANGLGNDGRITGCAWEFDVALGWLRLRRDTPLFRKAGTTPPLDPASRRGAGRDSKRTWFWIDDDRTGIRHRPAEARADEQWWTVADLHRCCGACAEPGAGFATRDACPGTDLTLSGLAVTTHDYLVVGYRGAAEAGLLLFDLTTGGDPSRLPWPSPSFAPWDLADLPDGGVLVLDAEHSEYWRLDRYFRTSAERPEHVSTFTAADGSGGLHFPGTPVPAATPLTDGTGDALAATAIEPGPGDSVLVLSTAPGADCSAVSCHDGATLRWLTELRDIVEVIDPDDPAGISQRYSVLAHDFVNLLPPASEPLPAPVLLVADTRGDQVLGFGMDPATGALTARDEFIGLRRWEGRALARTADGAWYDFAGRWLPLAVFDDSRYAASAGLTTPLPTGDLPGEPFDSSRPGCTWHRLTLDAFVPAGTAVTIAARAADEVELLPLQPWLPQPTPYLRGDGSELPWSNLWSSWRDADGGLPTGLGTHELLFQNVSGRYLQLAITATGNGRSSPAVTSVRAWYPRFSYVERYLPAVYAENDSPTRFLERFLANQEGMLTAIEEKIEHSHLLLDPRTARDIDLGWLASWFVLTLDPRWTLPRRRFLIRNVDAFYRRRGTAPGLLAILRVFFDPDISENTVFAVRGVPATTSRIRLVERFLTRGAFGTEDEAAAAIRIRRAAHSFEVQVPGDLSPDDVAMVERIVEQAKPAHCRFSVTSAEEIFAVGSARLGLDTVLTTGLRFTPFIAGSSKLARSYLAPEHPYEPQELR